jgi:hypothetical protein
MEIAYIALSILMNGILFFIGKTAIEKTVTEDSKKRNKKTLLLLGLILWQAYILMIGKSGILQDYSLPPRVLLFCILPAFLFTGIFLYKNRNNSWIHSIPKKWLLYYQTFRLAIETLFVFSVAQGIMPTLVTIKGYNFDLIFAMTAPMIGLQMHFQKTKAYKTAIIWNYLGLVVIASIIFLFVTAIYFPQLYGSKSALMPIEFGLYPYPLVPSFLMPSAVFIHVLSIMQLRKNKSSDLSN